MTNKERMLRMVLDDQALKERYKYEESDYEDFESALGSENPVVVAHACSAENRCVCHDVEVVSDYNIVVDVCKRLDCTILPKFGSGMYVC